MKTIDHLVYIEIISTRNPSLYFAHRIRERGSYFKNYNTETYKPEF